MQFSSPPAVNRMPGILPLLGVSLLSASLVLAMVCFSLSREEQLIRLPAGTLPRPPMVRESPAIAVRLSRKARRDRGWPSDGRGQPRRGLQARAQIHRLLGFEPSQATVVIRADADVPTDKVQRLMEQAQEAGFSQCVLRPWERGAGGAPAARLRERAKP